MLSERASDWASEHTPAEQFYEKWKWLWLSIVFIYYLPATHSCNTINTNCLHSQPNRTEQQQKQEEENGEKT